LLNGDKNFDQYKQEAENFMCKILPNSPSSSTQYTQGKGNIITEFQISNVTQLGQSKSFNINIYKKIRKCNSQVLLWAGGLMYKLPESNLQYVTSITFLLTTYSKYMSATKHTFNCGSVLVTPNTLRSIAKRQVISLQKTL